MGTSLTSLEPSLVRPTSLNKKERTTEAMMIVLSAILVRDPQGIEGAAESRRRLFWDVSVKEVENSFFKPDRWLFRDEEGEDEVA